MSYSTTHKTLKSGPTHAPRLPATDFAIRVDGKVLYPSRFVTDGSPPTEACLKCEDKENGCVFSSGFLGNGQNTSSAKSSNTVASLC